MQGKAKCNSKVEAGTSHSLASTPGRAGSLLHARSGVYDQLGLLPAQTLYRSFTSYTYLRKVCIFASTEGTAGRRQRAHSMVHAPVHSNSCQLCCHRLSQASSDPVTLPDTAEHMLLLLKLPQVLRICELQC